MGFRQALERMRAAVEDELGDRVICEECGCTLATYADKCSADLARRCRGFDVVEEVRARKLAEQTRGAN